MDPRGREYFWLHDSWKNPLLAPRPAQMPDAVLDWGMNGDDVVYHPYWRNPFVSANDAGVFCLVKNGECVTMVGEFWYYLGIGRAPTLLW